MDFNPDSFVIPEDKITRNGMSAAITIGFSDREDGDTTLFVTQFVALEKPKPGAADLYTMIVRTYSDDATTLAQLQPSRGDEPPRARPILSRRASRAHTASFSSRPLQAAPSAPASATLSMYRRNPEARPP